MKIEIEIGVGGHTHSSLDFVGMRVGKRTYELTSDEACCLAAALLQAAITLDDATGAATGCTTTWTSANEWMN